MNAYTFVRRALIQEFGIVDSDTFTVEGINQKAIGLKAYNLSEAIQVQWNVFQESKLPIQIYLKDLRYTKNGNTLSFTVGAFTVFEVTCETFDSTDFDVFSVCVTMYKVPADQLEEVKATLTDRFVLPPEMRKTFRHEITIEHVASNKLSSNHE